MSIIVAKIIYALGIAVVAILGGFLPFLFKRFHHAQRIMGVANACAGGIFLSVGLCHMLADGIDALNQFQGDGRPLGQFPMALCMMGVGGLIILLVEKVLLSPTSHELGRHGGHPYEDIPDADSSHRHRLLQKQHCIEEQQAAEEGHSLLKKTAEPLPALAVPTLSIDLAAHKSTSSSSSPALSVPAPSVLTTSVTCGANSDAAMLARAAHMSIVGCIVLVLALGVHSFIEGLALGVIVSDADALLLFIAIIVHKWAETAALSIAFIMSGLRTRVNALIIGLFSTITPLGIILGLVLDVCILPIALEGDTALLMRGILSSIAAGTFTYVSYMELITEAFEDGLDRWAKFILLLAGFAVMAVVALFD